MTSIAIIAFDGVTDIDVFLHWDILNRPLTMFPAEPEEEEDAADTPEEGEDGEAEADAEAPPEPGRDWSVSILGTKARHLTAAGFELHTDGPVESARDMDAVVVASGPLTRTLMNDSEYLSRLLLDPDSQLVAGQCSGALVLAGAGLLSGVEATTYPTAREALEGKGATFVERPFIGHDRIATAAGCLAGIELDRWLLTKLIDKETADTCINSAMGWGEGIEKVYA